MSLVIPVNVLQLRRSCLSELCFKLRSMTNHTRAVSQPHSASSCQKLIQAIWKT